VFFAIVGTFVLALVAGLLFLSSPGDSVGSEPHASAQSDDRAYWDEVYLTALGAKVMTGSAVEEISMGQRACGALGEGRSAAEVRQVLQAKGLTPAEAGRVMLAAVKAYCPDYAEAVNP
jgi:hypothetical protein